MSNNNEIQSFIVIKQEEIQTNNITADSETRLREDNTETILPDNHVIIPDTEMKQEEIDNTIADSETRLREENTETILPDNHVIIPDTHIKQEIVEDLETRAHDDIKQEESRDVSIHYSITTVK